MSTASPGIVVTPDEVLKTRGLANKLTELTLEISPHGGHLVAVAMYDGVHVCWGCCEPFDPEVPSERIVEKRVGGGTVPVALHRKCINPKDRKPFIDMAGSTRLQSVDEVARGLRLRRLVAKATKAVIAGAAGAKAIITSGG